MKTEFILMMFVFVALIGYTLYVIYFTLTKKNKKYNKAEDAMELYNKTHLFNQFIFPRRKFKNTKSNYKILKDEESDNQDASETKN
ncbi:MAG: hypothetical protein V4663_17715 [Bacteroidota bacterium]